MLEPMKPAPPVTKMLIFRSPDENTDNQWDNVKDLRKLLQSLHKTQKLSRKA
jgi:hypothetical protein